MTWSERRWEQWDRLDSEFQQLIKSSRQRSKADREYWQSVASHQRQRADILLSWLKFGVVNHLFVEEEHKEVNILISRWYHEVESKFGSFSNTGNERRFSEAYNVLRKALQILQRALLRHFEFVAKRDWGIDLNELASEEREKAFQGIFFVVVNSMLREPNLKEIDAYLLELIEKLSAPL